MLMLFISSVGGSDTQTMVNLPTAPEARLVIAAIGEAGEGKSTLLNLILNSPGGGEGGGGKVFFDVSDEPEACTTSPTYRSDFVINKSDYTEADLARNVKHDLT